MLDAVFSRVELASLYPKFCSMKNRRAARKLYRRQNCSRKSSATVAQQRGVCLFPANRAGDDVKRFTDELAGTKVDDLLCPQQMEKTDGRELELADFIAPVISNLSLKSQIPDHIGGVRRHQRARAQGTGREIQADHDDYNASCEALADRWQALRNFCTSAFVKNGATAKRETSPPQTLSRKGIAHSARRRLPSVSDHTEKRLLWELLDVEKNAGIKITESFAMWPGAA